MVLAYVTFQALKKWFEHARYRTFSYSAGISRDPPLAACVCLTLLAGTVRPL